MEKHVKKRQVFKSLSQKEAARGSSNNKVPRASTASRGSAPSRRARRGAAAVLGALTLPHAGVEEGQGDGGVRGAGRSP